MWLSRLWEERKEEEEGEKGGRDLKESLRVSLVSSARATPFAETNGRLMCWAIFQEILVKLGRKGEKAYSRSS